jgi:RimJ/RimL family protein N-acetyltransferase
MTPYLETPRLRLRGPGFGDARRIAEFLSNFAVAGNLARVPHPYMLEDARIFLSQWRADALPRDTRFIIELKREGGAIGIAGFHDHDGEAEIGYWLGEPYWGQGLMSEALYAILDWYFDVTDADVVLSGVFPFNMASTSLQMKFGFVETGISTRECLARGGELEHIDTELTREAYEQSRPKTKGIAAQ